MMTNMTTDHEDTSVILNQGLTVNKNKDGGLGVQDKQYSALLESTDNRQMVRNLYSSQKFHQWDHFLTHTCYQKNHFVTVPIQKFIDNKKWNNFFP